MEDNEENVFWKKSRFWHLAVIIIVSFVNLAIFSSTTLRLRISPNLDLTQLFVEALGPALIFCFLFRYSASGGIKSRVKQILEALYLWRGRKRLVDSLVNVIVVWLLAFSLILPILLLQSQLFSTLGYAFNFNLTTILLDYLIMFFTNILLVAFWEEILFRGYLLNFISRKVKWFNWAWAIVISSIVFMIYHIFSTPSINPEIRYLGVFAFGLFQGYNLVRNKNLFSNIVVHANINVEITEISNIIQNVTTKIMETGAQNFSTILNKIGNCAQSKGIDINNCIKQALNQ